MTCCANVNKVMKFKVMYIFRLHFSCASAVGWLQVGCELAAYWLRVGCASASEPYVAVAAVVLLSHLRFRAKEAIQAIEAIEAIYGSAYAEERLFSLGFFKKQR